MPQSITISNPGASSVSLYSFGLLGPNYGKFSLAGITGDSTIPPEGSCNASVSFVTPTVDGAFYGDLAIATYPAVEKSMIWS